MRLLYWGAGVVVLLALGVFAFGGRSDSPTSEEAAIDHVHGIAVSREDPDLVFVATHSGLYAWRADGTLELAGPSRDDFMGFTMQPDDSVMYSSGHGPRGGNLGLRTSSDGGRTWTTISDGLGGPVDFHALAVSPADPPEVYGYYGRLQRSRDGGATWEYASAAIEPISLVIHPTERLLYAATRDGVRVSENGGDAWQPLAGDLSGGVVVAFAINPHEPQQMLAFAERLGGMGRSTDGGLTWQRVAGSFGSGTVLYIAYAPSASGVVYAITDSHALYRSEDGGASWSVR